MIEKDLTLDILKLAKKFAKQNERFAVNYDTFDDFTQSLICEVFSKLHLYDSNKGSFSTWCFSVFKTRTLKDIHQHFKIYTNETKSLNDYVDDDNTYLDIISDDIDYQADIENRLFIKYLYQKILPKLSNEFKQYIFENKTFSEIARQSNLSKQYIGKKIDRERNYIRKIMSKEFEYEETIYY